MSRISVVIPTYNRADYLPALLQSVVEQSLAASDYEILVVDNASTDATRETIVQFAAQYPHIRYLFESKQGVSHARNRGLREATSPYVAFVDDDARADKEWLTRLLESFADNKPTPRAVVGRVLLDWQTGCPEWFPLQYETIVGAYAPRDANGFLEPNDYFLTMNVAIERQLLLEIGGFDPHLGPRGNRHIVGDDTELAHRLLSKGYSVFYESRAIVYHLVPAERRTRRYLLSRLFWQGATQPILDQVRSEHLNSKSRMIRKTVYDTKMAVIYIITVFLALFTQPKKVQEGLFLLAQQIGRLSSDVLILLGNYRR